MYVGVAPSALIWSEDLWLWSVIFQCSLPSAAHRSRIWEIFRLSAENKHESSLAGNLSFPNASPQKNLLCLPGNVALWRKCISQSTVIFSLQNMWQHLLESSANLLRRKGFPSAEHDFFTSTLPLKPQIPPICQSWVTMTRASSGVGWVGSCCGNQEIGKYCPLFPLRN